MDMSTPTFVIVGAVNHGKSSVVSTLAENDAVRISAMPGETVECQRFSLRDLFVFYDTPGFQNPIEALSELCEAEKAVEPLELFRDFISRHVTDPNFEAECRLFKPIVDGAGLIYVVDGSRPVDEDVNLAEMEILRLTGRPRLAIINRIGADDHTQDWKRRLDRHFNAVREFDAHQATFDDCIELLETLAGIEQSWKPKLMEGVAVLREEWDSRIPDCAEIILELLCGCLCHRVTGAPGANGEKTADALGEELKKRYMHEVGTIEAKAHRELIRTFKHNLVGAGTDAEHLFADDLFSEETWKCFGLEAAQLVIVAAISGALTGFGGDLLLGGHSLGLFTLAGGAIGAGGALVAGKVRPELSWSVPDGITAWIPRPFKVFLPKKIPLGGQALAVGPYRAINFPWILLDRAVGVFWYVVNRAHARRDKITLRASMLHEAMKEAEISSDKWPDEDRRKAVKLFVAIQKGKFTPERRKELRDVIQKWLTKVSKQRLKQELLEAPTGIAPNAEQ
jgi:hypothetical protein